MPDPPPTTPLATEQAARRFLALQDLDDTLPTSDLLPLLPSYTIRRSLGSGGGGSVFLGYRAGSERPLAIKILHLPLGASSEAARRATRELDLLMALRLPALPRLIDFGVHQGRLFIATEFIDGQPLATALDHRSLREKIALLARACDAVHSLHEHGVIHRDIKPANILIDSMGEPVVIDLGIARLLSSSDQTQTWAGSILGSPAYMSPEQARGERTSIRTDVYGLGATAYSVLTGQPPHDTGGTLEQALLAVGRDPPRTARSLEPALPAPLAAVLEKAVARRAEDRYESAAAMAADLRRWLQGDPVLAQPPGWIRRVASWAAKRPAALTAVLCASLIGLSIAFGAVGNWLLYGQPADVRIAHGGWEARLLSRSGRVLASWRSEQCSATVGFTARLPQSTGGHRVMFLSARHGPEFGPAERSLACLRLNDLNLEAPLWTSGYAAPEIVAPHEHAEPDDVYTCAQAFPAEVFAEEPGPEVVAVHQHARYGRTAVRIYRMSDGDVLYEAWHSGTLSGGVLLHPSPDGAMLLGVGVSNTHSRRNPVTREAEYPLVAFAIRPTHAARTGWINLVGERPDRPRPTVLWYRFLHGPHSGDAAPRFEIVPKLQKPPASGPVVAEVTLNISPNAAPGVEGGFVMALDDRGAVRRLYAADSLHVMEPQLGPEPEKLFSLRDMPPFASSRTREDLRGVPWP